MGFSTKAIHAGQPPEPTTGAIMTPVFLTSTYVQEELGKNKGYEYSRVSNPTRTALEQNIASLEGGSEGMAFGSGTAATDALMHLLKPGDHVILSRNVYGGTYRIAKMMQLWPCPQGLSMRRFGAPGRLANHDFCRPACATID